MGWSGSGLRPLSEDPVAGFAPPGTRGELGLSAQPGLVAAMQGLFFDHFFLEFLEQIQGAQIETLLIIQMFHTTSSWGKLP